jgi:hypothetical protein
MQPNVVGCRFTVITRSPKLALGTKTTRAGSVASKISRFRTGLSRAVALNPSSEWPVRAEYPALAGPRPVIRGPVPQSSEADTDPVSGRSKERCEIGVGAESVGNFNCRSVAWKRGSMRSGSMSGSVF